MKYFCGYVLFKKLQKTQCEDCRLMLTNSQKETLTLNSDLFILHKNYSENSELLHLQAPFDLFFEITKLHIEIFQQVFSKNAALQKIKSNIVNLCILKTNEKMEFNNWFDEKEKCLNPEKTF